MAAEANKRYQMDKQIAILTSFMKKQLGHNLDLIPKLALADQLETPVPKIKKSPCGTKGLSRSSARKTEEPKDGK